MKLLAFPILIKVLVGKLPHAPIFNIEDEFEEHNDKVNSFYFLKKLTIFLQYVASKRKCLKGCVSYFLLRIKFSHCNKQRFKNYDIDFLVHLKSSLRSSDFQIYVFFCFLGQHLQI